ncbi:MAG: hypothetical protein K2X09_07975 [Rickettsiales bacterium]|nr:hypothetical protein [Rickettsiales bacterium]
MAEPIASLDVPSEIFAAIKEGQLTARVMERHRDLIIGKDGVFVVREVNESGPTGNCLKVDGAAATHTTLGTITPEQEAATGMKVETLLGADFFNNLRREGRHETVIKGYRDAMLEQHGLTSRALTVVDFKNPQEIFAQEAQTILEANKKAARAEGLV